MNINTLKTRSLALLAAACVACQLSAQTLAQYQAEVMSQTPSDYFTLDGSLASTINPAVVLQALGSPSHLGGYTSDAFGNTTNAYFFTDNDDELSNETDPIISTSGTTNGAINAKGSISFLFRSLNGLNSGGERWLFDGRKLLSGAGTGSHNALALWFERSDLTDPPRTDPGSLKLEFGDTTQVILQSNDIAFTTWYYFALTWDEARVPNKAVWYLGAAGQPLMMGTTTNAADAVAGEAAGLFVGNRSITGGAFRSPGNGRIDEFAVWNTELTALQISNQFANLPPPPPPGIVVTNVIVNDSFADGNRTNTGPLQADWWSSSSSNATSIEVYVDQLGLVSGTSGRGIHGTFAPQTLGVGDTIRVTYTFTTPTTVSVNGGGGANFKVGLMDFNNAGLAADLESSSTFPQPLYFNLPGYMVDYDVNPTSTTANVGVRKHNTNTGGRFLSTTTEWTTIGSGGSTGYTLAPNSEYSGEVSITRTDFDSVDIYGSINSNSVVLSSHTESDLSNVANNYGMLGFWANSNIFGNTTTHGEFENNGITFSNIKIEVITTVPVPPPSLSIQSASGNVIVSWPVSGSTGFNLDSSTSLTSPITWASNGPPPVVVGDSYVVTNAASGNAKYYRLKK